MNKIQLNISDDMRFLEGDLFLSSCEEVFILTKKVCGWRAWSLTNGNVWMSSPPEDTPKAATQGLSFLGRDLKIIVDEI